MDSSADIKVDQPAADPNKKQFPPIQIICLDDISILMPGEWVAQCFFFSNMQNIFADAQESRGVDEPFSLAVPGGIMRKVCEWLDNYKGNPDFVEPGARNDMPDHEFSDWDNEYFSTMSNETLFQLINAADLLEIVRLFDAGCKRVAQMMKGASVYEMRQKFNLKSEDEKAAIQKAAEKGSDSEETISPLGSQSSLE